MDYKSLPILKSPYYKGKNFCANPVVKFGIPKYADASLDKKVIGTPDYLKYWEEQLYYIHNGYQTGGLWLPGRYYYFMNFSQFPTVGGVVTPDMCDLHLELAYLIEYAKKNELNIMAAKGRRKGISEFTQKAVIDYGYRFNYGYQAGVAAGLKDYAEDFMEKWAYSDSVMQPELRVGTLINNDGLVAAGYKIRDKGQFIEKGTQSKIIVRTMHSNPNMFKGLYLNDVIAEECGEFENLKEFYSATKACLTKGKKQVGTMFFYGTGGNINKGSKDFKEMWEDNRSYGNFIKFLIPATRFYFPYYGGASDKGQNVEEIPTLINKEHKPYQLVGVEDTEGARQQILEQRAIKRLGPLKDYLEELQNFPLDEKEIFKKTFSNNFDVEKLNDQSDEIVKLTVPKYSKYRLEWELNNQGTRTGRVLTIPIKGGEDESEAVYILDGYHPNKAYQNLYSAGIDPYDQDKAVSKSLGAMCVIIRRNTMGGLQMAPIAIICTRPKRKEIFFDMCLKLSVYYNIIGNVLGDKAGSSGIINWFKDNGFQRMLALRPQKFESENSEQSHEYWVSLNKYSRPLMVGLMQTVIYDFCQNIWFEQLIEQLLNFDDVEIGSDNDLADAFGIALMQDVSVNIAPRDNSLIEKSNPFVLPEWQTDRFGNLVRGDMQTNFDNPEKDSDYFGRK